MSAQKYQADRRRSDFTIVPNAVLRHTEIGAAAKTLYALVLYFDFTGEEPELDELGQLLGGGKKTAMTAVKELVDAGLLTSKRRGLGLTNAYIAHDPDSAQKCPEGTSGSAAGEPPSSKDLQQDEDVGAKAPTSAGGKLERARNVVFDAMVEATAANPADGGKIGKSIKAIRLAMEPTISDLTHAYLSQNPQEDEVPAEHVDELIAGQIRIRADLYRQLRPDWELTPTALASHWNRIPTWQPKGMQARDIAQLRDEDFGVNG